jgi:hypothetical protein
MGTKLLANICFQTEQRQHQRARPLHTLFDDFILWYNYYRMKHFY